MFLRKEQAEKHLPEFVGDCRDVVLKALAFAENEIKLSARLNMSDSANAHSVHCFMVMFAKELAAEKPKLYKLRKIKQMHLFCINVDGVGIFAIRLKKLDDRGMSKSTLTGQVLNFRKQLPLPGIEPAFHLEMGYVLDTLDVSKSKVYVVCPNGPEKNLWRLLIDEESGFKMVGEVDMIEDVENESALGFKVKKKRRAASEDNDANGTQTGTEPST